MIFYYKKKVYLSSNPEVSLLNRGLIYGETVFSTIRVERGLLFFLEDHLDRLNVGITHLLPKALLKEFDFDLFRDEVYLGIEKILKASNSHFSKLRITCFLNSRDMSLNAASGELEFFIMHEELNFSFSQKNFLKIKTQRRNVVYGDSLFNIKSGNYFNSFRMKREAFIDGFDDVLFLTVHDEILESSTSNLFFLKNNIVFTPKLCDYVLSGITRKRIIDCLKNCNYKVEEKIIKLEEVYHADCVWLTSSLKGIQGIKEINSRKLLSFKLNDIIKIFNDYSRGINEKKT